MLLNVLLLLGGLIALIYGANSLVDGGSSLAHRLKVTPMVIGLTIVAFGTSTPELVVNLVSSLEGSSALALGNVVGSNIFNTLAILGITALIVPLGVKKMTTWVEIPLAALAAALVLLFVYGERDCIISRTEGICLLVFFIIFLIYTFVLAKTSIDSEEENLQIKDYSIWKSCLFILIGLGGLIIGGRLLVTNAIYIAQAFGISERIIGLTIVSIGTSLPELATSIIAAHKKNADIAIGNVVGSNIFNTFLILGASATITPLQAPVGSMLDLTTNIVSSVLLFIFIFTGQGRKINRWEGGIFFTMYILYMILLIQGFNIE